MGTDGLQRSLAITLGCLTNIFVYRQSNFWWTSKLYKLPPFEQTLVCLSRIFIGQRMVMNDNHQSSGTLFTPNPYCLPRKAVFLLKRICVSLSHHVFDLPILCLLAFYFLLKVNPQRARSATHNKPFRSKLGTILPASRICLQNQFEAPGYPAVCSLPRNGVVSAWHAHSPVKLFPNRCEEHLLEWPSGHPLNLVRGILQSVDRKTQGRHVEYVDEYCRASK